VLARGQVLVDAASRFWHQIAFHIVDELFPNLSAIDLDVLNCRWHNVSNHGMPN